MKSIQNSCKIFNSKFNKLNFCIQSQGIASVGGRKETNEGIDEKMSLHYYGRICFIQQLERVLQGTATKEDVRVLSIFSGGVHSSFDALNKAKDDFECDWILYGFGFRAVSTAAQPAAVQDLIHPCRAGLCSNRVGCGVPTAVASRGASGSSGIRQDASAVRRRHGGERVAGPAHGRRRQSAPRDRRFTHYECGRLGGETDTVTFGGDSRGSLEAHVEFTATRSNKLITDGLALCLCTYVWVMYFNLSHLSLNKLLSKYTTHIQTK